MYTGKYNNLERFSSYLCQIKTICEKSPKRILEIGIGNKVVSNYLREAGFSVTTCDLDKTLNPDIVADIRKMPFKDEEFDMVTAFEVLEHIPYSDVETGLKELNRISSKTVVISIPFVTFAIYGKFKFLPFLHPLSFMFRVCEYFWHKHKFNGTHYWEMGTKGYSRKQLKKLIKDCGFEIKKELTPELNPYHYFFVLEKTS
jgi:ubiquinone/menaquinone biosynthesis C-methylase UbiE